MAKMGLRLTTDFLDCANNDLIDMLIDQICVSPVAWDMLGSIPCDPWSTWQSMCIHWHSQAYRDQLQALTKNSKKILHNFIRVAKSVHAAGGRIAYEYPELQRLSQELDLYVADCDGCSFGTTNQQREPILKQWRVITDCGRLAKALAASRCKHEQGFRRG